MLRTAVLLLTAAFLLAPIAAFAQIPSFTLEQTHALRWFTLRLQQTKASNVVQEMHWSGPPSKSLFTLPGGVEHIYAEPTSNTLLIRATPDGFKETKKIVKLLDVAGYKFAPTLTFMHIQARNSRLNWSDGPTQGLEVSMSEQAVKTFQELTGAGTETETVLLDGFYIYNPMELVVDTPRLRDDGSLTLDFTYGCWDGPPVELSGIHPGSILAVRGKGKPQVTFIRVDY